MYIKEAVGLSFLLSILLLSSSIGSAESRRIRVRPTSDEDETNVRYYAALERNDDDVGDDADDDEQRVVLVSSDRYNGYYGDAHAQQQQQQHHLRQPQQRPQQRPHHQQQNTKQPPVQTIRNYNKVNDDGSFTFGYEAADGSFKEETRGTDCVVRGKYGYIDPDGNKREFTYVSGNPCDPNAPKQEEEEEEQEQEDVRGAVQNYPTRPIIRKQQQQPQQQIKTPVSLFQSNFESHEEEQLEPEQILRPTVHNFRTSPSYSTPTSATPPAFLYQRVRPTTPSSVIYKQQQQTVTRLQQHTTPKYESPATTYRPQLLVQSSPTPTPPTIQPLLYSKQVSVTPRPHFLPSSTVSPLLLQPRPTFDLENELRKYQQQISVVKQPQPQPEVVASSPKGAEAAGGPVYSSELVYDPTTGQYKTQLYQTLPQSQGDFKISQQIQPYVSTGFYRPQPQIPPQTLYKQQQAGLQFQNSAELFAQQQQRLRAQQQQQQQQQQRQREEGQATAPKRYYLLDQRPENGQIDTFLRGHNIQF